MKPSLLSIAALAVLLIIPVRADEIDDQVKRIRETYNSIESAKLRAEAFEYESKDEPLSGTCTRYFKGDELVKVKLSYVMGDHGGNDEYFYYQNGRLIFAYATDSSWVFNGKTKANGESGTTDSITEHRIYLNGGRIIRHLFKQAKADDPKDLAALLSKAENKPSDDAERATRLFTYGEGAAMVKSSADLGKLLAQPE